MAVNEHFVILDAFAPDEDDAIVVELRSTRMVEGPEFEDLLTALTQRLHHLRSAAAKAKEDIAAAAEFGRREGSNAERAAIVKMCVETAERLQGDMRESVAWRLAEAVRKRGAR